MDPEPTPDPADDAVPPPGHEVWRAEHHRVVVRPAPGPSEAYGPEDAAARDIQIDAPTHHGPLAPEAP